MKSPRAYPELEGWMTVAQVAELLGVSRQACHKMLADGLFTSVHRLGNGIKPMYVISTDEASSVLEARRTSK